MSELPGELTAKPLALVAITGLDTSNAIHKSVWDAFINNRRPDSAAIQYKLLAESHEFPTVKPKVSLHFTSHFYIYYFTKLQFF